MRYMKYDGGSLQIVYKNPITGSTHTTALVSIDIGWPELRVQLESEAKRVVRAKLTDITADELLAGYTAIVMEPGDQPKPIPSDLFASVDLGSTRASTPNYRSRKASGEILMNPYFIGSALVQRTASYDFTGGTRLTARRMLGPWNYLSNWLPAPQPKYDCPPGYVWYQIKNFTLNFSTWIKPRPQLLLSPAPTFNRVDYGVDEVVVTEALAKRNDGAFDVLTELAEFPETLAFITSESKKAIGLTVDLELEARAKKRVLSPTKYAKWLANHWLKGRYALLPIFYGLNDMSEVVRQMGREYGRFSVTKETDATNGPVATADSPYIVTYEGDVKHSCTIKSRYSPDDFLSGLAGLLRFNAPATFWELVPLSFVADWAFNMGDYLSAAAGTDLSTQSMCSYAFKDNRVTHLSYNSGNTYKDNLITTVYLDMYERLVINPSDHIGLNWRFEMGWKRYVDAAALSLAPSLKLLRRL